MGGPTGAREIGPHRGGGGKREKAISPGRGGAGEEIVNAHLSKKVARSIQSNATVQVLPGLAGYVPSPYLIMRTKSQQNVKANGGLMLRDMDLFAAINPL